MLKKQYRLLTNFEFNVVRRHGIVLKSAFFNLYFLFPRNYIGNPKVGIITSVVFDKSAVKRNRAKRIFSEIIRLNFDKLLNNVWIVVYPKRISLVEDYEKINSEFVKALQKISVLR